jgi:hypothetical protein
MPWYTHTKFHKRVFRHSKVNGVGRIQRHTDISILIFFQNRESMLNWDGSNCSIRILWTVPVNVCSLFLAVLPFSNQFQSILNVTIDIDDLKNKINFIPKTRLLTWVSLYSRLHLLTFKLKWLHFILFSRYKYVFVNKLSQATFLVIIQKLTCYWVVLLTGYCFI